MMRNHRWAVEVSKAEDQVVYACDLGRSVVPDSLPSHGLQPTRLLCPRGFSKQEYWSGLPCPPPGDLPNPGMEPRPPPSPSLQMGPLPSELPGSEAQVSRCEILEMQPNSYAGQWRLKILTLDITSTLKRLWSRVEWDDSTTLTVLSSLNRLLFTHLHR